MKILKGKYDGHGSSHTPIALDKIRYIGINPIEFENLHSLNAQKVKKEGKLILETKWTHYIALQREVVYQFHTYMIFDIEEDETPATAEQAIEILNQSHKQLIDKWEERRQTEVNFFPSILPLTTEQIAPFALPLTERLNVQLPLTPNQ